MAKTGGQNQGGGSAIIPDVEIITRAVASSGDAVSDGSTGLLSDTAGAAAVVGMRGWVFNGTTWDRLRGTTSGIDVGAVIPGTGATNLGKAIDTALGATDTGTLALTVRDDALSALTEADDDVSALRVDNTGKLWTHPEDLTRISVTFTPDDTPDYAAGDAYGGLLEFANASLVAGGTGEIVGLVLSSTDTSIWTTNAIRLYLLNQTFTATTDNAVFDLATTEADDIVAIISGGESDDQNAALLRAHTSSQIISYQLAAPIPYVLEAATTSLFGQLQIEQAANHAGSQTVTVNLIVRRF